MTDVIALIDELEGEILGKKNFFGKCYVDEMKVTNLLSRLREAIPQSFYEAQSLVRQQDVVLSEAERRADSIVRNANETRDKLVADSEVLAQAKKQADDLRTETERYCDSLTDSVHQKMDRELYEIAYKINDAMSLIEDLREELLRRSGGFQKPDDGNS